MPGYGQGDDDDGFDLTEDAVVMYGILSGAIMGCILLGVCVYRTAQRDIRERELKGVQMVDDRSISRSSSISRSHSMSRSSSVSSASGPCSPGNPSQNDTFRAVKGF